MSQPFIGEIKIWSSNYAPKGWAMCNGQVLPINQNMALFSLLGTAFGGNGSTNFALPNFQGRVPIHVGGSHLWGEPGGTSAVTLTRDQLPAHNHTVAAVDDNGNVPGPAGALPARFNSTYRPSGGATTILHPTTITATGANPHENRQPYLVLMFCIATQGIFPSRN